MTNKQPKHPPPPFFPFALWVLILKECQRQWLALNEIKIEAQKRVRLEAYWKLDKLILLLPIPKLDKLILLFPSSFEIVKDIVSILK